MKEPMYDHIEFCRDAKTLWGKLQSRKWDWLGVHPDGKFVLGSPRVARTGGQAALTVTEEDAEDGLHGVIVHTPEGRGSSRWCKSPEESKAAFASEIERLSDTESPLLIRVRRIENRRAVEEEFVVLRPSTYR